MAGPLSAADRLWLTRTLDLAARGEGRTSPNPMVGAILVGQAGVVGSGHHQAAGREHAETLALREAGVSARGATLYLNLEPCCEHRLLRGRSPTCVDQILDAGVARVVAACRDPNPRVDGRGFGMLAAGGVEVAPLDPLLERRALRFNEVFAKYITTDLPFVSLKAGASLDGRIALPDGSSRWITGEEARARARGLRGLHDAVLVGIATVLADDPLLLPGHGGGEREDPPRTPLRVVLDPALRLGPDSQLGRTARQAPVLVYASAPAPPGRRAALEASGAAVAELPGPSFAVSAILGDLGRRGIASVLVEGGGETLGRFVRACAADRIHLFMAPRLIGGRESVAAFGGDAPQSLALALDLEIDAVRPVGGDLWLQARPRGRAPVPSPGGGR